MDNNSWDFIFSFQGKSSEAGSLCVSYQWTGPGVGEAAQLVPAHVEDAQGFQTVHDCRGQTGQTVIRHIQLLQLTQADPVSS